ncbi:hypothetical protein RB601_000623 [Gaeumannomyces tritici]
MEIDSRATATDEMAVDSPVMVDGAIGEELSEHARPRKRTRRACDKCSASRTRCNGECPCRRCEDYGYACRYNREIKKRGRAPISMSGASGDSTRPDPSQAMDNTSSKESCHTRRSSSGAHGDGSQQQWRHHSHRASFGSSNGHAPTTHYASHHGGGPGSTPSPSVSSPSGGGGPAFHGQVLSPPSTASGEARPSSFFIRHGNSYSDSAAVPRPPVHGSNGSHGITTTAQPESRDGGGLTLAGPQQQYHQQHHHHHHPAVSTSTTVLPGILTVPAGPNTAASPPTVHPSIPAYLPSLHSPSTAVSASGGSYGTSVHAHMQLASLLDSTAVMDHPGTAAVGMSSAHHHHHHHQSATTALARAGGPQHEGTSPPGGRVPSVAGSQHTAGGPGGGGTDAAPSDESAGYPSPDHGAGSVSGGVGLSPHAQPRGVSFSGQSSSGGIIGRTPGHGHSRGSFSTSATSVTGGVGPGNSTVGAAEPGGSGSLGGGAAGGMASTSTPPLFPDIQRVSSLYRAPSADCRYACLAPVLPYLGNIIPASVACDLLDVYLTEPGSSLFRCASPYILTRIFRKRSLLHPTRPRPTTPALLATMLWCAAQTADIVLLHVPGSRSKITNALYELSTSLISARDPDRWRRIHGGLRVENDQSQNHYAAYIRNMHGGGVGGIGAHQPETTATNEPAGLVDDVLTLVLLSIAVSGGDFKSDCFKWWSKAIRLTLALGLHREDDRCSASISPCANPLCSCRRDQDVHTLAGQEACEERRRVFWLVYCLDRHLSLSFNSVLSIPDSYCQVYAPLPEGVWEDLDAVSSTTDMPARVLGPPGVVTGTGFFEYFLPLMATLGDIIEVHHRRLHPRLGGLDDSGAVALIGGRLAACERSLERMALEAEHSSSAATTGTAGTAEAHHPVHHDYRANSAAAGGDDVGAGRVGSITIAPLSPAPIGGTPGPHIKDLVTGGVAGAASSTSTHGGNGNGNGHSSGSTARGGSVGAGGGSGTGGHGSIAPAASSVGAAVGNGGGGSGSGSTSPLQRRPQPHKTHNSTRPATARDRSRLQLVLAYSTHILHVLHVLLHGKWDAISMLDDDDDWITSTRFNDCATHAISASQAVSRILRHDPELTFMPYLFGIYLLHGSFILLLFADRMPQLGGPNQSVEQACETIVRAHEVCVVTLSTEFQKNFRKVLRSTLYSVRGSSPTEWEEHKARRRALSLYRWTRGAKGLAL